MTVQTHVPLKLWPVWSETAQRLLRAMLGEIEGLAITGGESSVRLSPSGIERGRWLAGFSPLGVSSKRLIGLPYRLGMPEHGAVQFRKHWSRACTIFLGVEQTPTHVVAKVYLEYALPFVDSHNCAPERRQVALHIESCKWRFDAPNLEGRYTEYWRMSGLDGPATVALLHQAQDLDPALLAVYAGVGNVLEKTLHAVPDWHGHRLLLVRESGTSRQGLAVRFYGSELRAGVAMEYLSNLLIGWGLAPQRLSELMPLWGKQELGWLQAGLDAQGQPNLIVYGALNRADTRAVLWHDDTSGMKEIEAWQISLK